MSTSGDSASFPEVEASVVDPQVAIILRCLAPEEIDMLRDAFIYMDRDSDGFVSMEEMLRMVEASVAADRYEPLRAYLTPLYHVADKDGDGKLSLTEFLMSFADGPGVVPADVINSCVAAVRVRLTDEEISALQENFRAMDTNGDGFLDPEELEVALRLHLQPKFPDLTDNQYQEVMSVIMASADADHDGRLCLSEFIRSFQEDQGVLPASFVDVGFATAGGSDAVTGGSATRQLSEDQVAVLREAFAVLDKDDDGYVDFVDLYDALWASLSNQMDDKTQIKDLCDLIMATADRHRHGRLSLSEFILGFLRNMELMQIPVAVAQSQVRSACDKLQRMHESGELERLVTVFEDLDRNGDGYLDRAEMANVLIELFKDAFPEWDEETLNSVMNALVTGAGTRRSGRISLEEFIRSFVDGPGMLPPEALRALDTRASAVAAPSPTTGARPRTASDADLIRISNALRDLNETADDDGCVTEEDLRRSIEAAFDDQRETHPEKPAAMVQYVLSRFVRKEAGGRLAWNENVQIEDDEEAAEPAPTQLDDAGAIHVPAAEEQERHAAEAAAEGEEVLVAEAEEQEDEPQEAAAVEEPAPVPEVEAEAAPAEEEEAAPAEEEEAAPAEEEEAAPAEEEEAAPAEEEEAAPAEEEEAAPAEEVEAAPAEEAVAAADDDGDEDAESQKEKATPGTKRRRRMVHASSVDMAQVKKSTRNLNGIDLDTTDSDEEESEDEDAVPRKSAPVASAEAVTAAPVVEKEQKEGAEAPAARPPANRLQNSQFDGRATVPAVVEEAALTTTSTTPALLSAPRSAKNGGRKLTFSSLGSYKKPRTGPSTYDGDSIFEAELRMLFKTYDAEKLGYLDRNQFKQVYVNMEHYGLEPTQYEINQQFTKYSKGSDKIFFDEFCVLMLQRVQM